MIAPAPSVYPGVVCPSGGNVTTTWVDGPAREPSVESKTRCDDHVEARERIRARSGSSHDLRSKAPLPREREHRRTDVTTTKHEDLVDHVERMTRLGARRRPSSSAHPRWKDCGLWPTARLKSLPKWA